MAFEGKNRNNSYFGFKMHILVDKDFLFIRELANMTVSFHDSRINLI